MSSLERTIKRKEMLKHRKKARKGYKDAVNAVGGLPTNCTQCKQEFDLKRDADTWVVNMSVPTQIQLLCPKCCREMDKNNQS